MTLQCQSGLDTAPVSRSIRKREHTGILLVLLSPCLIDIILCRLKADTVTDNHTQGQGHAPLLLCWPSLHRILINRKNKKAVCAVDVLHCLADFWLGNGGVAGGVSLYAASHWSERCVKLITATCCCLSNDGNWQHQRTSSAVTSLPSHTRHGQFNDCRYRC